MKRKAFAALAAVCLVLCLILAGCGTVSEEDYPRWRRSISPP